jgi:hypothetical protein
MADVWAADAVPPDGAEDDEGVISQEDCWSVIQAYFDENVQPSLAACLGLLRLVPRADTDRVL